MQSWLVVPDKPFVVATSYLPDASLEGIEHKRGEVDGHPLTIVPNDYQTWRKLRGRGMLAPAPLHDYTWPGPLTPMAHQVTTVEHLIANDKAFCLNGLRTGKTLSALWAADALMSMGEVRRVLVVAPLFITDIVWERVLFTTLPKRSVRILKGTRKRKQELAEDTSIEYIIVNPESLHLVAKHLPEVDVVIVDEFTKFKNVRVGGKKSQRYAALELINSNVRFLWMLSGTPAPQAPTDAYGPVRLVNPRRITFTAFREATMFKVSEYKWLAKRDAHETVARWMQPAVRFKREDCIEIPEVEVDDLPVSLSQQQRSVIQDFLDDAAAKIREHVEIRAANAAAAQSKILQVMGGGVYGEDPEGLRVTHRVNADPFLDAIESTVQEAEGPVLVFSSFLCSVEVIVDHLTRAGYRVGSLTRFGARVSGLGKIKSMELFDMVQAGSLDALVAIPQTMKYGLELTASNTVLWTSPPSSYETYEQANARPQGSSQKRKVLILHLVQSPFAKELFNRLSSREAFQNAVLDLLEGKLTI